MQKLAHVSLRKEGHPFVVTVPLHRADLPRGTLRGILSDAGLTIEEFVQWLSFARSPRAAAS